MSSDYISDDGKINERIIGAGVVPCIADPHDHRNGRKGRNDQ